MPEILGLFGPCRSLFAQRTSPGAWEQRRYPIVSRIAMALQAHSVGSVRLLKLAEDVYRRPTGPGKAEFDAIRSPTLQTSVPGVHRWARPSVGDV
jgi:hypothetical protein